MNITQEERQQITNNLDITNNNEDLVMDLLLNILSRYKNVYENEEKDKIDDLLFRNDTKFIFECLKQIFVTDEIMEEMNKDCKSDMEKEDQESYFKLVVNINSILSNIDIISRDELLYNDTNIICKKCNEIMEYFNRQKAHMDEMMSSMNDLANKLEKVTTVLENIAVNNMV